MSRAALLTSLLLIAAVPAWAQNQPAENEPTGHPAHGHPGHAAHAKPKGLQGAIQSLNDKWVQAYNSGDAAAVAALYAEDATVLPPGTNAVHGREAIQAFWQGAIQHGIKNPVLTTESVEHFGKAAREIGHVAFDTPEGHAEGKYVVVWIHDKGEDWQLNTDIWNMNK